MDLKKIENLILLLENNKYDELKRILISEKKKVLKKDVKRKNKETLLTRKEAERIKYISEKFRTKLIENQTEAEKKFKALFKSAGIKYNFQEIFYYKDSNNKNTFFIADFYLFKYNIIVEIDGLYHSLDEQKVKDKKRANILKKTHKVFDIVRFNNNDIVDTEYVLKKLKSSIDKRKALINCSKYCTCNICNDFSNINGKYTCNKCNKAINAIVSNIDYDKINLETTKFLD